VRVTPPTLTIRPSPPGFVVSWFDPSGFFVLQSSSNLQSGTWTTVTNNVEPGGNSSASVTVGGSFSPAFYRLALPGPMLPQPETVMVGIIDANGISVKTNRSIPVALATAYPAFTVATVNSPGIGWGVESPYDPGLGTTDRQDWVSAMNVPLFGNNHLLNIDWASQSWDFIDSSDNFNGINNSELDTVDIALYIGHGNPDVISFTSAFCPQVMYYNAAFQSWGNVVQEWLGLLSCEVLEYEDSGGVTVVDRWGPNFDGLHFLLGFTTVAEAETGFPTNFVAGMSSGNLTIEKAWFAAAKACQTGSPACLAPLGTGGACDTGDYWWGVGPVGPRLRASQIKGWAYLTPGF
jgi:hypothetical protein